VNTAAPRLAGAAMALAAAALFGFSTPLAKLLIDGGADPLLLAGLLYVGSGLGLAAMWRLRGPLRLAAEAPLRRSDWPWLGLVIATGGVAGPALLMIGLAGTPATLGALLLNAEGIATMAIAWIMFRENADRRVLTGAAAILAGAIVLVWRGPVGGFGLPALAIVCACLAWAVDNNLTRKLSGSDPVQIGAIKGFVAGAVNLALALARGAAWPKAAVVAGGLATGALGYGASVVLFILALRGLGAARTSAYFSCAPFLGAALSLAIFHEPLTVQLALAAVLMGLGVYLHLSERHEHEHAHEALAHNHRHVHDAHHQHAHAPDDPPGEPHVHGHRHEPLRHSHAHYPDLHHRHGHGHSHKQG
jgi:drug/metabolite transporter (DMT)-like permease